MLMIRPLPVLVALLLSFLLYGAVDAAPQGQADGGIANGMTSGEGLTAQEQAAQGGLCGGRATDGGQLCQYHGWRRGGGGDRKCADWGCGKRGACV